MLWIPDCNTQLICNAFSLHSTSGLDSGALLGTLWGVAKYRSSYVSPCSSVVIYVCAALVLWAALAAPAPHSLHSEWPSPAREQGP